LSESRMGSEQHAEDDPSHEKTDSAHVTFCAGLPYVGKRPLTTQENAELRRKAFLATSIGYLLATLSPLLVLAGLILIVFGHRGGDIEMGLHVVIGISLMGVATLLFLIGGDFRGRGARQRTTAKEGFVRRFEGPLGWQDPTDDALAMLIEKRLIQPAPGNMCAIELLPHLDSAFSVNGIRVTKDVPLEITTATARPVNTPVWGVPIDWIKEGDPNKLERRRLTPEEQDEIRRYGRFSSKDGLKLGAMVFMFMAGITVLINKAGRPVLTVWQRLTGFRIDTELILPAAVFLAVCVTFWTVLIPLYRGLKTRRTLRQEADFGWIIVEATKANKVDATGTSVPVPGPVVEWLPVNKLMWTIDGKPAGWRRNAKGPGVVSAGK